MILHQHKTASCIFFFIQMNDLLAIYETSQYFKKEEKKKLTT